MRTRNLFKAGKLTQNVPIIPTVPLAYECFLPWDAKRETIEQKSCDRRFDQFSELAQGSAAWIMPWKQQEKQKKLYIHFPFMNSILYQYEYSRYLVQGCVRDSRPPNHWYRIEELDQKIAWASILDLDCTGFSGVLIRYVL